MVNFTNMIGSSMADMMSSDSGAMNSASKPTMNMENSSPSGNTKPSFTKSMEDMEGGSMVDDAQALVTEVTEQMAMLSSMQEGMNPERVASLLMMPAPMD